MGERTFTAGLCLSNHAATDAALAMPLDALQAKLAEHFGALSMTLQRGRALLNVGLEKLPNNTDNDATEAAVFAAREQHSQGDTLACEIASCCEALLRRACAAAEAVQGGAHG